MPLCVLLCGPNIRNKDLVFLVMKELAFFVKVEFSFTFDTIKFFLNIIRISKSKHVMSKMRFGSLFC